MAAALRLVARPDDTFFDVGANVGYHSLLLADVFTKGRQAMHLFEPNPDLFRCLQRTVHSNAIWTDVVLNQVALSDRSGNAELSVFEDLWSGGTLQAADRLEASDRPWNDQTTVAARHTVPTTTLDNYCREHGIDRIGLMKIDTEGHEESVFAGMQGILEGSPDLRVVLEFTFGAYDDPEAFWDRLSAVFPHRFHIPRGGALQPIGALDELRSATHDELADVLLARAHIDPT